MRPPFLCALILVFVLTLLPAPASEWLVAAVPQTSGKDGQVLTLSQSFDVILSNTTLHDLKLWNEWSAKGYFNLSFEFKGKDGKIIKVEKNRDVFWFKHSPEEIVVQPGCAYTIAVDFSTSKEWNNVQSLNGSMTMRVIYQYTKGASSSQTRQVKSDPIKVIIER